ncbi:acireductone synthase [Salinibius halmophilus]|uniref:acireductone synthase n=1 Tax=Salinibius halmophilus TaxID=1853216 RepID=UPI000E66E7C6|nr:acireductone synthase [Salinibius halmophilus]
MIKAILTDIEGTTSSIEFVADVLFPYAKQHLAQYVGQHSDDTAVAGILAEAAALANISNDVESVVEQLLAWIDEDVKATPLKTLQGMIWQHGYESGELKGHIFADASAAIQKWAQHYTVAIYSSGSVQAQQLLFKHSQAGDLTPYLSQYFDTKIGHKRETESYQKIAEALALAPDEILFLSDVWQELEAARNTGVNVLGLKRGVKDHPTEFTWVNNFDEVDRLIS